MKYYEITFKSGQIHRGTFRSKKEAKDFYAIFYNEKIKTITEVKS